MSALSGIKVLEIAAIGPVPFCGMMLADMGATVVRVDRTVPSDLGLGVDPRFQFSGRGKESVALDLKNKQAIDVLLRMVEHADVLIEGFRPGVMERLGIGPDECLARNPRLVYGRMTGWGQSGPAAEIAGHDINYIALSGVLHSIGEAGRPPVAPLNLVGDYGGGALYLAVGVLAALVERAASGRGQVVDAAMVDGAASLMTQFFGMMAAGRWSEERGTNPIDGGAHFYNVYETADGQWMAVGAIETKFYEQLLAGLGLSDDAELRNRQMDPAAWPGLKARLAGVFRTKTRAEWAAIFAGTDACASPVLRLSEAPHDAHLRARGTFVEVDGTVQPAPAPRFNRTPSLARSAPAHPGQHSEKVLRDWGFDERAIAQLKRDGVAK